MTRENAEFLKEKGKWHPESELRELSKMSLKEIEQREQNIRDGEFAQLDYLYDNGKIDFENPPKIWTLTFNRWMLKRFGVKTVVDYLKNFEYKSCPSQISGRLKAIGCSDQEIEEALKEPEKKLSRASVCRIANKVSRSVSRQEAFKIAWKIVKNGGYEIRVAGVSFERRQEALKRLTTYDPKDIHALLIPETDNKFDPDAIAVKVFVNNQKGIYLLGYVPKTETVIARAFLGTAPILKVVDGDLRGARLRLAA